MEPDKGKEHGQTCLAIGDVKALGRRPYSIDALVLGSLIVEDREDGTKRVKLDCDHVDLSRGAALALARILAETRIGEHDMVAGDGSAGYVVVHRTVGGTWVTVEERDGATKAFVPDSETGRLADALKAEPRPSPGLYYAEIKEVQE